MLRAYDFKIILLIIDSWGPILQDISYVMCSTHHTSIEDTPVQLVFGHDMLFNMPYTANWTHIEQNKEITINKYNLTENDKRVEYDYKVDDEVYIYRD